MIKIRVRYSKFGKVRFLSHRDLARAIERSVRLAGLPVAYSEGFSPRPRLHFGLALSTGYESDAEYFDVDVLPEQGAIGAVEELPDRLAQCLPPGVTATRAVSLEPGTPSLQEAVTSCAWRFELGPMNDGRATEIAADVAALLAADEFVVELERKGKQVHEDLRPLIVELSFERTAAGNGVVYAELGTKPRSVRPAELLAAFRSQPEPLRVVRTHQWTMRDGERCEPIELAVSSPHAEVRAS
ncbi:MAG: TIGR03936 family radical SAM-associated protein [Actinomycetes bacterium]